MDIFAVQAAQQTHGRSLLPLIRGTAATIRDHVLSGVWGREVHLIDDTFKYARAPAAANAPLSMWSNRWSTMPVTSIPELRLPLPDERAVLDRMPGSTVPVIRQPFRDGDIVPFWALGSFSGNHLYNLRDDPAEEHNLAAAAMERLAAERLRVALQAIEAPDDQLVRLGLA
jgi:hypothetical protein